MNIVADMKNFMLACGLTVDEHNVPQAKLYEKLTREENREFQDALIVGTEAQQANEMIDSIYVLVGYGLSRGWPVERLWDAVHGANMRKVDPETGAVRRRADGKILKPEGWQPADIEAVLAAAKAQREAAQAMLGR